MIQSLLLAGLLGNLLALPIVLVTRFLLNRRADARGGLLLARGIFVGMAMLPWLSVLLGQWMPWTSSASLSPIALTWHGLTPGAATAVASPAKDAVWWVTLVPMAGGVWALVSIFLIAHGLAAWRRFRRLARHAIDVEPARCGLSLPAGLRLGTTAAPVDAFVSGLRQPRIVVPLAYLEPARQHTLRAVVRHEMAHVRHRDTFWLPACRLLLCLCWPIAPLWLAYRDLRLQTELAADQHALRGTRAPGRHRYARALFEALHRPVRLSAHALPGFHSRQKRSIHMRIARITQTDGRKPRRISRKLAATMAASLLVPALYLQTAVAAGSLAVHFMAPLHTGRISSVFGERHNPITGKQGFHTGVDIAAPTGTPILAPADGTVAFVGHKKPAYGLMLVIRHADGYRTVYQHLQVAMVKQGESVTTGMVVAKVGNSGDSTGPHVHLELYRHGKLLNPASYLPLTDKHHS